VIDKRKEAYFALRVRSRIWPEGRIESD